MNIVVLDKSTLGFDIDLTPIRSIGKTREYENTLPDQVAERIQDADAVVINKIKLGRDNLKTAKNLKLICVAATGFDNIDLQFCKEQGIALCNVPGYSTKSVAQLTVSMALCLLTHLDEYNGYVHSGKYSESGIANSLTPVFHEICGLKWGVVGGGGIGMYVADIASALGCDVVICRQKKEGRYPVVDIDTLCRECDIISLHIPLSDSTRGIISRQRIESMKDGVMLINTARGAVTDEAAVADAVLSGKIGALGVDVYSAEPFGKDHPFYKLLGLKNVCLTPHMAWGSYESRTRCINEIAKNITAFINGDTRNRII